MCAISFAIVGFGEAEIERDDARGAGRWLKAKQRKITPIQAKAISSA